MSDRIMEENVPEIRKVEMELENPAKILTKVKNGTISKDLKRAISDVTVCFYKQL